MRQPGPRILGLLLAGLIVGGCADPKEQYGRTWYIDGAGNWGYGVVEVPLGLEDAGYRGAVTNHRWSLTMNPALDQTFRFIAKQSGEALGHEITSYLKKNPGAEANIIALSAGTGVGMWAIERVEPPYKVSNYFLLGSSISSKYDVRPALRNMKGRIYVYHASTDPVLLGPVQVLGTIDGTFDAAAGLVGLQGPGSREGGVVNVAWSPRYRGLGWTGGHTDCTNRAFVRAELGPKIVKKPAAAAPAMAGRSTSSPQTVGTPAGRDGGGDGAQAVSGRAVPSGGARASVPRT